MNRNDKTNFKYLVPIIIGCIIASLVLGYFFRIIIEKNIIYKFPPSIKVSGVTFLLEDDFLTCTFVPEIYSKKLDYQVIVINHNTNTQKIYEVNIENGIGSITIPTQNACTYKFILTINNKSETRNIIIEDKLHVNLIDNVVISNN